MDDAYEWVSTREAAARLGVSPSTVERMVRRGGLIAERIERPGGTRLLIRLDRPQEPRQVPSDDAVTPETLATLEAPQATSDATMRLLDMVGDLRERVGRAEERADRLLAEKEQWAIDGWEQAARAIRAEVETEQQRVRANQEHARLLAMATELGETRAARLFAQTHRDQILRERDALKAELERARRPWWRWWR